MIEFKKIKELEKEKLTEEDVIKLRERVKELEKEKAMLEKKIAEVTSKYEEETKKEAEITKQLAVAEVRLWIEKIPEEKRDEPAIVVATKTFTPRQMVEEVEKDTEYGRKFGQMLNLVRLELAKKEE